MGDSPVELNLDFGAIVGSDRSQAVAVASAAAVDGGGSRVAEDDSSNDGDPYNEGGDSKNGVGIVKMEEESDDDDDDDDNAEDRSLGRFKTEDDDAEGRLLSRFKTEEDSDHKEDLPRKSLEEEAKEEEEAAQSSLKRPAKIYQPSSLLHLATSKVASNIEKYPPSILCILSEYHWECVIKARIALNDQKKEAAGTNKPKGPKGRSHIGYDGDCGKKKVPALCEKYLLPIERHPYNKHLARSKKADVLLWRVIVDFNFVGMSRPRSMDVPFGMVKERLKGWGEKLVELVDCPLSQKEFEKSELGKSSPKKECKQEMKSVESGVKRKRNDVMDDLFGEEEEEVAEDPAATVDDDSREKLIAYQRYLEIQSNKRTNALRYVLESLKQSPMDVTLLSETEIGKCANKVVKSMKKLAKQIGRTDDEREIEKSLNGYPRFWKQVMWGEEPQRMRNNQSDRDVFLSPFQILQRILQDWKDMASENGIDVKSSPPPSKKKRRLDVDREATAMVVIATCGKDKRVSPSQHRIDMKLLRTSPDWRSLYRSLREREGITQKSHGDKIRGIRESLEKGRAKVGKVTLKRAVGRVRGNGSEGGITRAGAPARLGGSGGSLGGGGGRTDRREAILNKSRGIKARHHQMIQQQSSYASQRGGGKMSQLRQETKVASSWRKSGVAKKAPSSVVASSFGASVAASGSKGNSKKPQSTMKLGDGKQIKLPSVMGGLGKTVGIGGVFSTLQKKKVEQERQQKQQRVQKKKAGSIGTNRKMLELRKQGSMRQQSPHQQQQQRGNRDDRKMQQQRKGSGDDRVSGSRYR